MWALSPPSTTGGCTWGLQGPACCVPQALSHEQLVRGDLTLGVGGIRKHSDVPPIPREAARHGPSEDGDAGGAQRWWEVESVAVSGEWGSGLCSSPAARQLLF